MNTKKIIPCLDIKDGRIVKGINFEGIKEVGDPIEYAIRYQNEGADELVVLDISATIENRDILTPFVRKIASHISIPFIVGGGINSLSTAHNVLEAGADKISINSAALLRPEFIGELEKEFGSKKIVVAIDTSLVNGEWKVFSHGGTMLTNYTVKEWARRAEELGAGEILLTSKTNDGTKSGFSISVTNDVSNAVQIPVIASGGAGNMAHFAEVFEKTNAKAALGASVFHFGEVRINELKQYLKSKKIEVK